MRRSPDDFGQPRGGAIPFTECECRNRPAACRSRSIHGQRQRQRVHRRATSTRKSSSPRPRCWWISGPSGACPAGCSRPRSRPSPTSSPARSRSARWTPTRNRNVAVKYGINAIPTVILFKDGQVGKKFVGLTSKDDLAAAINERREVSDNRPRTASARIPEHAPMTASPRTGDHACTIRRPARSAAASIGVGRMGRHHARVYAQLPDCELVGVVDADPDRAEAVAEKCGCRAFRTRRGADRRRRRCGSRRRADDRSPRRRRAAAQGRRRVPDREAARRRCRDARAIKDVAERNRPVLMVGHIERFNPIMRALQARPATACESSRGSSRSTASAR